VAEAGVRERLPTTQWVRLEPATFRSRALLNFYNTKPLSHRGIGIHSLSNLWNTGNKKRSNRNAWLTNYRPLSGNIVKTLIYWKENSIAEFVTFSCTNLTAERPVAQERGGGHCCETVSFMGPILCIIEYIVRVAISCHVLSRLLYNFIYTCNLYIFFIYCITMYTYVLRVRFYNK